MLECSCKTQQLAVIATRRNELDRERHAGSIKAGRQADCRIACEVEGHRIGIPSRTNVLDLLAVDLDRAEKVLVYRHRGSCQRWQHDNVAIREPGLYLSIETSALEDGIVKLGGGIAGDTVHLPHESRAHDVPMSLQVVPELRHPV